MCPNCKSIYIQNGGISINQQNGFFISTEKDYLNVEEIHHFLDQESYWANDIPKEFVENFVNHSFCFGVYKGDLTGEFTQVGFARVVTDYTTFGYLADVYILEEYRGQGLSKWLMKTIAEHPSLATIRVFLLGTKDAHTLYEKYGFRIIDNGNNRFMGILKDDMYKRMKK